MKIQLNLIIGILGLCIHPAYAESQPAESNSLYAIAVPSIPQKLGMLNSSEDEDDDGPGPALVQPVQPPPLIILVDIRVELAQPMKELVPASMWDHISCSMNVFGVSHHAHAKANLEQVNPGVGLHCEDTRKFLGGYPYVEANLIALNSRRGDSETLGAGLDWELQRSENLRLRAGGQLFAMRYRDAVGGRTYTRAPVPALHAAVIWKETDPIHVALLPPIKKKTLLFYYSWKFK